MKNIILTTLLISVIIIVLTYVIINNEVLKDLIFISTPPKDLFDYLVNERLDVNQTGIQKFEFRNKYKGKHSVGIILEKFSNDLYFMKKGQEHWKLKIKVDFYVKDSLAFSSIKNIEEPFIGKDSGYFMLIYECPKDLPIDQTVTCSVTIIEPDYILANKYGPARFYIKKMSDK